MYNENHSTRNIIIGGSFSLFSGLLFTLNRAMNDLLDLNFVDTLLIVFIFRSAFFFVVILCQNPSERTLQNSKEYKEYHVTYPWWIYTVEKGKSLQLMRAFLLLQGLFGGLNNLGAFLAVTLMPIGDAHALIFSAPLPTMVLSKIIFGTRLKLYKFFWNSMSNFPFNRPTKYYLKLCLRSSTLAQRLRRVAGALGAAEAGARAACC